jgi:predicted metal-dependent hydrolase
MDSLTHYLERNHGERFTKLMDGFMPSWPPAGTNLMAPLSQPQ